MAQLWPEQNRQQVPLVTHSSLTSMVFTGVRGISQLLSPLTPRAVKGQKVGWPLPCKVYGKAEFGTCRFYLGKLIQAFVISYIRKPVLWNFINPSNWPLLSLNRGFQSEFEASSIRAASVKKEWLTLESVSVRVFEQAIGFAIAITQFIGFLQGCNLSNWLTCDNRVFASKGMVKNIPLTGSHEIIFWSM